MANVADLNLIQINNFPEVTNPSEWIVVSDAEGTAYKISKENFKAFLGTVTVSAPKPIGPTDGTPELDGVYIPTAVGVYPNFGGLERLESDGYVQFIKNGAVYAKVNTPMPEPDLSEIIDYANKSNPAITNLINNGSFENDLTDWILRGEAQSTVTSVESFVGNKSLRINVSNATTLTEQEVVMPNGNIAYVSIWAKTTSSNNKAALSISYLTDTAGIGGTIIPLANSDNGRWFRYSGTRVAENGGIRVSIGSHDLVTADILFDGVTLIDLTAIFGAGNEPTAVEFERLYLNNHKNKYFDGTVPLVDLEYSELRKGEISEPLPLFSSEDIKKYPVLRLIKSLDMVLPLNVENVSIIQIGFIPSGFGVVFNFNGRSESTNWEQTVTLSADVSSNPDELVMSTTIGSEGLFAGTTINLVFDYKNLYLDLLINLNSKAPDNRIFINQSVVDELTKKDTSLASTSIRSLRNERAILSEGHFLLKDYWTYDFLGLIKSIELTGVSQSLSSLGITAIQKIGNNMQIIMNENDTKFGAIWNQDIVMDADVSSNPSEIIFQGQNTTNPKVNVKIVFDYSKWNDDYAVNNQYIADGNKINIDPLYIESLKNSDFVSRNYPTMQSLIEGVTEVGASGFIGDLEYKRISSGTTEAAFKRCFYYPQPSESKLRIIDHAKGFTNLAVDVTQEGIIRVMDIQADIIYGANSMTDLENGTYQVLYDLKALNPSFTLHIRYFWQLEDNKLLIFQTTRDGNIGGLWILDQKLNTLTKSLTFRNEHITPIAPWSFDIRNNVILFTEYGVTIGDPVLGDRADATRIWKSTDNGSTFTELYNFRNLPNVVPDGLHIHGVHYDVHWDRIWVTMGDVMEADGINSSKRIAWSDDQGLTWKSKNLAHYFGEGSSAYDSAQGLSIFSTNDFVLMGGDDYRNCIYRIAKVDKVSDPVIEIVYRFDERYTDRITQYTGRFMRLKNGMIVVPLMDGDHAPRRSKLLGTIDGLKWFDLWVGDENNGGLAPANDMGLTELNGDLYMQHTSMDNEGIPEYNLFKFKISDMV